MFEFYVSDNFLDFILLSEIACNFEDMNHIIVKDENSTVKLPTQNCRVCFKNVKTYFPETSGLVYYDSDNEQCGLELINDEFQLIPGKIEYRIFYANLSKREYPYSDSLM